MTVFEKEFLLLVWHGYEYACDEAKKNPGVLSFVSQKIGNAIYANFILNLIVSSHY